MSLIRRTVAATVLTLVVTLGAVGVTPDVASASTASAVEATPVAPVRPDARAKTLAVNTYDVHTCGTATCTIYLTIRATRTVSTYGWSAAIAAGRLPSWLAVVGTLGAGVINQQARSAINASPDRCLHFKMVNGGSQVIGIGTSHHTNTYCRSGS